MADSVAVRIGATLGIGAVGRVVRIDGGPRELAGKILHPSHRGDPAAVARFAQEARVAAALRHPNIVEILGHQTIDGESVLLMEFVDGPTLAQVVAQRAPLPEREVLALLRGIAAGLTHAHAQGVIHRDLKPANILVAQDGTPKIADFGMARGASLGDGDRDALVVLGTPDYMAPECLDPLAVDGRSDLYALGCIAHELLTGAPPYAGATPHAVLRAHREDDVPALPAGTRSDLAGLVQALLAKSPGRRPQAASAVVDAIDRMLAGEQLSLAVRDAGRRGHCAVCSRPLLPGVAACLHCGHALLRHEPGNARVIITGPGEVGDKIDNGLRLRLHEFLAAEPELGLRAAKALDKQIPRLPFVLATGIARAQADAMVAALGQLGIAALATEGWVFGLPQMRRKAATLSGRVALIVFTAGAGLMNTGFGLVAWLVAGLGVTVGSAVVSVRSVTRAADDRGDVPRALRDALGRTVAALPAMTTARHRETVHAVAERALALAARPELADDGVRDELARAIDAATVAAAALDELDRKLGDGLGGATEATRELLRARDLWAQRLQRVLAELEAVELRLARARTAVGDRDALAELRLQIEALEEVQR